jgi:hypothetical protein
MVRIVGGIEAIKKTLVIRVFLLMGYGITSLVVKRQQNHAFQRSYKLKDLIHLFGMRGVFQAIHV